MQLSSAQQTLATWKISPPNQAELDMLAARVHAKEAELLKAKEELEKKESSNRASTSALARQKQDVESRYQALNAELGQRRAEWEAEKNRRMVSESKLVEAQEKLRMVS